MELLEQLDVHLIKIMWVMNPNEVVEQAQCMNKLGLNINRALWGSNHEAKAPLYDSEYTLDDISSRGMMEIIELLVIFQAGLV